MVLFNSYIEFEMILHRSQYKNNMVFQYFDLINEMSRVNHWLL